MYVSSTVYYSDILNFEYVYPWDGNLLLCCGKFVFGNLLNMFGSGALFGH